MAFRRYIMVLFMFLFGIKKIYLWLLLMVEREGKKAIIKRMKQSYKVAYKISS